MGKERKFDIVVSLTCTEEFYQEELSKHVKGIRSGSTEKEMAQSAEGGITKIKISLSEGGGTKEVRLERFLKDLTVFKDMYDRELLNEFYRYWTEISPGARKHRWECERFFDLKKRLAKFHKNNVTNFGKIIPQKDAKKLNESRTWNH